MLRLTSYSIFWQFLAVIVCCLLAGWLEPGLVSHHEPVCLIRFLPGIAVAALLAGGIRLWPAVLLGSAGASLWARHPLPGALIHMISPVAAGMVAVHLLKRAKIEPSFLRLRSVIGFFMLGVCAAGAVSATISAIGWSMTDHSYTASLTRSGLLWWPTDSLGILLLAAPVLSFRRDAWRALVSTSLMEALLWMGVVILLSGWVFQSWLSRLPMAFLLFPVMIWGAIRLGAFPTSIAALVLAIFSTTATISSAGPFGELSEAKTVLVHSLFLGATAGAPLLIAAIVAEDQASTKALRESQILFQAISEQMPDGLFLLDSGDDREAGTILHVNHAGARMRGCAVGDLIGQSIFDLVEPNRHEGIPERLERLLKGKTVRSESTHRRQDGSTFPVDISSRLILFGGRRAILLLLRDITQRRKAEQELKHSRERLDEAQKIAGLGSWEWYPETGQVIYSPQMHEIMGLDPETFGGTLEEVMAAIVEKDRAVVQQSIEAAVGTGATEQLEYCVQWPNGEVRTLLAMGAILDRDEHGNLTRLFGTALDITDRKKEEAAQLALEARMLQEQKVESLEVLAGGVAHDFNNLLTVIMGNASLALLELPAGASGRESIQRIEAASQRAADLCEQMLAYSGKGQFQVKPVDLTLLVQEMSQLLESILSPKVTLRSHLTDQLPAIEADATQLRQIVLNLMTNASESFENNSGMITLTTETVEASTDYLRDAFLYEQHPEGAYVQLKVTDTGAGFDSETRDRLFDPFFSTKFTGRGLGLAAVLGIVRAHRGLIKVDSEPGKGTTFTLLFPPSKRALEPQPAVMESSTVQANGEMILIIDDEVGIRTIAAEALRRAGYETITAEDGAVGLAKYKEHRPRIQLVLLDLTMPKMTGEEVFQEIIRLDPQARILLSSGYTRQQTRFSSKDLAGFIQKPYQPGVLVDTVQSILGQPTPDDPLESTGA